MSTGWPTLSSIRFQTDQTRGVGTEFLCDTKVGPIRLTDRMEITEWTPAVDAADGIEAQVGRMGVRHTGIVTGSGVFTIEPIGTGTRFTWSEKLDFPWYLGGRLGEIIGGKLVLGPIWRRNLEALRRLVDARLSPVRPQPGDREPSQTIDIGPTSMSADDPSDCHGSSRPTTERCSSPRCPLPHQARVVGVDDHVPRAPPRAARRGNRAGSPA